MGLAQFIIGHHLPTGCQWCAARTIINCEKYKSTTSTSWRMHKGSNAIYRSKIPHVYLFNWFQLSFSEFSSVEFSCGVLCVLIWEAKCVRDGTADAGWAPLLVIRAKDPRQKEMLEGTSPLAPGHLAKQGSKCSSMSPHVKGKDKQKHKDKGDVRGNLPFAPSYLAQEW